MESINTIDVSSYEKNKTGEVKLIKDLFELLKEALGQNHKDDTLEMVLHSYSSVLPYLEKYEELKKEGAIKIDQKNTPCGKNDEIAIESLLNSINKRIDIASLTKEQRDLFEKKNLFILGKRRVILISKNFTKENIQKITEAVVLKFNKIYPQDDNLFVNILKDVLEFDIDDSFEF